MRLHHVGIVTDDLESAVQRHKDLFNLHPVTEIVRDPIQKVEVVLLSTPGNEGVTIELIAPLTRDSPVSSFLSKGTGLYHVCFEVDDIDKALANARKHGAIIVSKPTEARLYEGRRISFLYTRDKYLVEFVER